MAQARVSISKGTSMGTSKGTTEGKNNGKNKGTSKGRESKGVLYIQNFPPVNTCDRLRRVGTKKVHILRSHMKNLYERKYNGQVSR